MSCLILGVFGMYILLLNYTNHSSSILKSISRCCILLVWSCSSRFMHFSSFIATYFTIFFGSNLWFLIETIQVVFNFMVSATTILFSLPFMCLISNSCIHLKIPTTLLGEHFDFANHISTSILCYQSLIRIFCQPKNDATF